MATKGGVICREGRQQERLLHKFDKENAPCLSSFSFVSFSVNIVAHYIPDTPSITKYQAHLSVIMIMNPFKFVVAAAAAVLLAGTQSVAAKPFVGSLGGLNTLLDFRVEVDAANACDAMAYSDGSVTRGLASVFPSFLKKIEKEIGHGTITLRLWRKQFIKCKRSVSRRPHSSTVTLTPMSKGFARALALVKMVR